MELERINYEFEKSSGIKTNVYYPGVQLRGLYGHTLGVVLYQEG